jgi:hypothetical protein
MRELLRQLAHFFLGELPKPNRDTNTFFRGGFAAPKNKRRRSRRLFI